MAKVLPKPEMRHLLAKNIKFHLAGALVTSITAGLLMKVFYCDARKKAYDDFQKHYDADAHEERMINAGLLQSVPKP